MSRADYDQQAMDLVGQLAELPDDQRHNRLEELCAGDAALRARVLTLLQELSRENAVNTSASNPPNLTPSWFIESSPRSTLERIGPYRLLRRIGVGAMAEVYEAEQDRPRRRVALKLIHPLCMSPGMLRRFEFEVEVLGRLEHPGIARVYDAGTAETAHGAQPFFAMELVRGHRLDRWVELYKPDLRQRLELLIQICDAVQHAHQHGVIHRDLKPSNILVNEEGKAKVLDFGVARAIEADARSIEASLHTQSGQLIGTLQYMSPEQAAGDVHRLDTRCDVYALGVIAYQLLTDRLPYEVSGKLLPEALRVIQETEPTLLSTIDRRLRGDVETIVLKALSKEKDRRYPSCAEFSADVRRYLEYEPITARPPSAWYQISRYARRHKALVAAGTTVVLALLLGTALASFGLLEARQQRAQAMRREAEAQAARANAEAVLEFFTRDVVGAANPTVSRKPEISVREALDHAAKTIAIRFKQRPQLEAAVRNALAVTYASLGRADLARPHAEIALELCRREMGDDHPSTLDAIHNLADVLQDLGLFSSAEHLYHEAVERSRQVLGSDHPNTLLSLNSLGSVLQAQGKLSEAEPLYREALAAARRVLGETHPDTLLLISNMASLLEAQGKLSEAEPLYREALAAARRVLGEDHPHTLVMMSNLALLLQAQDRLAEAEPISREGLERRIRVLGEEHPDTLRAISNLGYLLKGQGKLSEAEPLYRDALERRRRVLGEDHPDTLISINNLGSLLEAQERFADAEQMHYEGLERSRRVLGDNHPHTLRSMSNLTALLERQGKFAEAEPLAGELYRRAFGVEMNPQEQAFVISLYGLCLAGQGKVTEAEGPLREAYARLKSAGLEQHDRTQAVLKALVEVCQRTARPQEADHWRGMLYPSASQPATDALLR